MRPDVRARPSKRAQKQMRGILLTALAAISMSAIMTSCQTKAGQTEFATYRRNAGFVFGTSYNLIYKSSKDLSQEVQTRLRAYDASVSVFNEQSLMSELNRGTSVTADSDMLHVLTSARTFWELSGGAFDVTVAPLSAHWRFTKSLEDDTISVEQYEKIASAVDTVLPLIGMDKVNISGMTISKAKPEMKINANALAEGYGIDLAAKVLEDNGVTDYLVEIGGEIHCKGLSPRGGKWRVGIDRPIEGSGVLTRQQHHILEVTDCAISTSGNYRQCYHVADGRTMQHTIDPKSGHPVRHNMLSVTTIGPNTMTTDALCTGVMVAGPDSAFAFVRKASATLGCGIECLIVYRDADGTEREEMTDGFRTAICGQ